MDLLGSAARVSVKAAAAVADVVVPPGRGVVFLIYHQVGGPTAGPVNLSVEAFEAQIAWLAVECRPVRIDEALEALARPAPPEPDPVVITFDDGTAGFVDAALPVLERYQVPATLYLATRWVDEGRSFWDDGTVLSWGALRDACSSDLVTIGSHTHSHALLDRIAPENVDDELDRSIALIGENLGVQARHFAYPKALAPSASSVAAVRQRFASAALAGSRPNRYGVTDPFSLARTPVQVADGRFWFTRKARGGLSLEDRLRSRVASRRYAGSSR